MPLTVFPANHQLEGGGFEVARPFPTMQLPMIDPFLLLDQMGPKDVGPREAVGAPDHPHRGFETVTYMLSGCLEHRDSQGHHGQLGPGDVQWMTAGSGVVHSEMPEANFFESGGHVHGIQLWVNLPQSDKMMPPRYQEFPAAELPRVEVPGGWVRVLAGSFGGVEARIDTRTPIYYLHVHLEGGSIEFTKPVGHNGFVYVLGGNARIADTSVAAQHLAVLPEGTVTIAADEPTDALVISGAPIGEPVARWGPFVMNTDAEVRQALADFQAGEFGRIPARTSSVLVIGADDAAASLRDAGFAVRTWLPDDGELPQLEGVLVLGQLEAGLRNQLVKRATTSGVPCFDDGTDVVALVRSAIESADPN